MAMKDPTFREEVARTVENVKIISSNYRQEVQEAFKAVFADPEKVASATEDMKASIAGGNKQNLAVMAAFMALLPATDALAEGYLDENGDYICDPGFLPFNIWPEIQSGCPMPIWWPPFFVYPEYGDEIELFRRGTQAILISVMVLFWTTTLVYAGTVQRLGRS